MLLSGQNIHKSFRGDNLVTTVLKGVNIDIQEREFVAIMGKSGSGKSTLLNTLSTLDRCDTGKITFEGEDISQLDDELAAKLRLKSFGFIFQLPRMIKNLNILDNILLPSVTYKHNKEQARKEALQLMTDLGIQALADKRISQVSGGQLQRAGICRALINQPHLLFADEPTGALDTKSSQEVLELFRSLKQQGRTILMVTHDAAVAAKSERVLFMKDGRLQDELQLSHNVHSNLLSIQNMVNKF